MQEPYILYNPANLEAEDIPAGLGYAIGRINCQTRQAAKGKTLSQLSLLKPLQRGSQRVCLRAGAQLEAQGLPGRQSAWLKFARPAVPSPNLPGSPALVCGFHTQAPQ